MTPLPLRTSLTLIYTSMLAVLLTALGFAYHTALVRQLDADATQYLEERARSLHGYLRFTSGQPVLVYNHDDPEVRAFIDDATQYYQVYDGMTGRMLVQSPDMETLGLHYTPGEVAEFRAAPDIRDVQTDRGRLRLSTSLIMPTPGEAYVVQVGDLLAREDRILAGFDRYLIWRLLAGLVVAAAVGRWLAGRALVPFVGLAASTHNIGIANLHDRLAVRGSNDELDQVALSFNQALARVEQSVGEMRQFSAALAHELRTPIAILRGEAELALRHASSPEQMQRTLTSQIEEFDRLTRLINQILTLARAEAGEIAIAREPVDLSTTATAIVDQLEPVAASKGVALTSEVSQGIRVTGDGAWLQRLLLILLDNAIKFTRDGGRVSLALTAPAGRAKIVVRDTGIGIDTEALPKLFERFYRADSSRSRETEGAGLGLALAKWIAERHGASIEVSSTLGSGSTFTVTFPSRAG